MARSIGPILAAGTITVTNTTIIHGQSLDFKVILATGVAATMLAFMEQSVPELAIGISWIALFVVLFTRTSPNVPAPMEYFAQTFGGK